jgi:hypothetical protein
VVGELGLDNRYLAIVDKEAMDVVAVSSTTITVKRGSAATHADAHLSGETVMFLDSRYALLAEPSGACTAANIGMNPKPLLNSQSHLLLLRRRLGRQVAGDRRVGRNLCRSHLLRRHGQRDGAL